VDIHECSSSQLFSLRKSIRAYLWIVRFISKLRVRQRSPHPADGKSEASAFYIAATLIDQHASLFEYRRSTLSHLLLIQQSIPDFVCSSSNAERHLIRPSSAIQPVTEKDSSSRRSVISRQVIYNRIINDGHFLVKHAGLPLIPFELRIYYCFFQKSQSVQELSIFFVTCRLYFSRHFNVTFAPHPPEYTFQLYPLLSNEVVFLLSLFIQQQPDSYIMSNEDSKEWSRSSLSIQQFSLGYQLNAEGWIYSHTPITAAFIHQSWPLSAIQHLSGYQREAEGYVHPSTPKELSSSSADRLRFRIPFKSTSLPKVNQVVLIHDSPFKWTIAIVIRLIKDQAGFIRIAHIRTMSGAVLIRPIQRIHPLKADGRVKMELERLLLLSSPISSNYSVSIVNPQVSHYQDSLPDDGSVPVTSETEPSSTPVPAVGRAPQCVGTSQQRAKRSPQPLAAGGSLLSADSGEGALSSADRENKRHDVTDGAETKGFFVVELQWEFECEPRGRVGTPPSICRHLKPLRPP